MTIRPILTVPNPILKEVSKPVEAVTDETRSLMDDMLETMYEAPGIGLAATQVDVHQQVVVIDISENKASNFFGLKRQNQNKNWLLQTLDDQLKQRFYQDKRVIASLEKLIDDVINDRISPFRAAEKLLQTHHK